MCERECECVCERVCVCECVCVKERKRKRERGVRQMLAITENVQIRKSLLKNVQHLYI